MVSKAKGKLWLNMGCACRIRTEPGEVGRKKGNNMGARGSNEDTLAVCEKRDPRIQSSI
jgi:hypothetical protein